MAIKGNMNLVVIVITITLVVASTDLNNLDSHDACEQCQCSKHLKTVNCERKKLTEIPSGIPYTATELYLGYNNITVIPVKKFINLTNLLQLSLKSNAIHTIEVDAFQGLENLKYLYLTNNRLKEVSNLTLRTMPQLRYLYFTNNLLEKIPDVGAFRNLIQIALDNNNLSSVKVPGSFTNLTNFTTLTLSNNPRVTKIEKSDFIPLTKTNINKINLARCNIKHVINGSFLNLTTLTSLVLSYNPDLNQHELQNIIDNLSTCKHLDSIDLSNSVTGEFLPDNFFASLENVPLHKVSLKKTSLEFILNGTFSYLHKVDRLDLSEGRLLKIMDGTFLGMNSLQTLLLYSNNLVDIPGSLPRSLRYLDLHDNKGITEMSNFKFELNANLENISLAQCSITRIGKHSLKGLVSLEFLDLSMNKIGGTNIAVDFFAGAQALQVFNVSHNLLYSIGKESNLFKYAGNLTILDMSHNSLHHMPDGLFQYLKNVRELRLEGNSLSKMIREDNGVLFKGMDQLENLNLGTSGLDYLPSHMLKNLTNLKTIFLKGNLITHWGDELFKNLMNIQFIDLSHNRISIVNQSSVEHIDELSIPVQVDFSNNPFNCFCDMIWFRTWVNSTNVTLINISRYICASPSKMIDVPFLVFDPSLITWECYPPFWIYAVGGGAVVVILLCILSCIYCRYYWAIRLWIYRCKCHSSHRGYNECSDEYQYLATLSYSDEDCDWLTDPFFINLKRLGMDEDIDENHTIYYEENEFGPNKHALEILDGILVAMNKSKYIFAILSEEYLKDGRYCYELWNAAHISLQKNTDMENSESKPRLYCLILEKKQRDEIKIRDKIPKAVRNLIKDEQILTWSNIQQDQNSVLWHKIKDILQRA